MQGAHENPLFRNAQTINLRIVRDDPEPQDAAVQVIHLQSLEPREVNFRIVRDDDQH